MEFMIEFDNSNKEQPFMDMAGIWIYNIDKSAFKSKYADTMNSIVIKELLSTLNCSSLSDLAVFLPPWESYPHSKGIKYEHFWNELRQGRKIQDKVIAGSRIIICNYYNTKYALVFNHASALNPSFIAFVKGSQPSV